MGAETNLVENRAGEIGAIFFVFFPCGALQSSSSAPPSQRSLVLMRVWCAAIGVPSPQFAGPLSNRLNGQNRPIPRWRAQEAKTLKENERGGRRLRPRSLRMQHPTPALFSKSKSNSKKHPPGPPGPPGPGWGFAHAPLAAFSGSSSSLCPQCLCGSFMV